MTLVKLVQIGVKQCSEQQHPYEFFLLYVSVVLAPVRSMVSTQLLSEIELAIFLLPSTPGSQVLLSSHISRAIQHLYKATLVM